MSAMPSGMSTSDISASSKAILISATNRGCCEDNVISLTGCYAKILLALWWWNHTPGL